MISPPFALPAAGLGLVVGSFLNVAIHRLPRGESVVRPGSRCPACSAPIRWRDNLPLVSWVWLGGRCRSCRARIPVRYPLVELASAAVFATAPWGAGWWAGLVWSGFLVLLLALAVTDLEAFVLPDWLTLPGAAAGLLFSVTSGGAGFVAAGLGALLGAGLLLALRAAWLRFRRVEALGLGDIKMMLFVGAFLGPSGALWAVGLASVLGLVAAIPLLLLGRIRRDTPLPFGAFIAVGSAVVFVLPGI